MLCAGQAVFEWDPLSQGAGSWFGQQVKRGVYWKSVGSTRVRRKAAGEGSGCQREPGSGNCWSVSWGSALLPCSSGSAPTCCVAWGGRHWLHVHIAIFPSMFHLSQDPNHVIGLAESPRATATVVGHAGKLPMAVVAIGAGTPFSSAQPGFRS